LGTSKFASEQLIFNVYVYVQVARVLVLRASQLMCR